MFNSACYASAYKRVFRTHRLLDGREVEQMLTGYKRVSKIGAAHWRARSNDEASRQEPRQ
jgi:hypothetical protein